MHAGLTVLGPDGLRQFQSLKTDAVGVVAERFYAAHGSTYVDFGPQGRESCRKDLMYHLEFLHPALEFGHLEPMVDYLRWLASVLAARSIPVEHVAHSLDLLAAFFAEKMDATSGALVGAALRAARAQFLEAENVSAPELAAPWPEAAQFESALLAGRQREASSVVSRCIDSGRSLVEVEHYVIRPSLYHIGEGWQANHISVAGEHLATAIAQSVMITALLRSPPPEAINKRILLACVTGNEHALGLRMVADAFQLAGWDLQYLGANVPNSAVVQHTRDWEPDLIALSVVFPQQLPAAKQLILQLHERFSSRRPAVIVGGLAINRFNRLARTLGADAYSPDALSAVIAAGQLVRG